MRDVKTIEKDISLLEIEIKTRNHSTWRKHNSKIYWLLVQALDDCEKELRTGNGQK